MYVCMCVCVCACVSGCVCVYVCVYAFRVFRVPADDPTGLTIKMPGLPLLFGRSESGTSQPARTLSLIHGDFSLDSLVLSCLLSECPRTRCILLGCVRRGSCRSWSSCFQRLQQFTCEKVAAICNIYICCPSYHHCLFIRNGLFSSPVMDELALDQEAVPALLEAIRLIGGVAEKLRSENASISCDFTLSFLRQWQATCAEIGRGGSRSRDSQAGSLAVLSSVIVQFSNFVVSSRVMAEESENVDSYLEILLLFDNFVSVFISQPGGLFRATLVAALVEFSSSGPEYKPAMAFVLMFLGDDAVWALTDRMLVDKGVPSASSSKIDPIHSSRESFSLADCWPLNRLREVLLASQVLLRRVRRTLAADSTKNRCAVCLSVCLSFCLSVCLSVFLSFCLSVCLSVSFSQPMQGRCRWHARLSTETESKV